MQLLLGNAGYTNIAKLLNTNNRNVILITIQEIMLL